MSVQKLCAMKKRNRIDSVNYKNWTTVMCVCRCECFGQYLVGEVSGAKPPVWQRTGQIILTWFPPLKKLRIIYIVAERLSVCTGVWEVRRKKAVSFMWWTKIAEQIRFAVGSKTCCVRCVILRVITLHLCHCFFVEPLLCTQMKTGSLQCYLKETISLFCKDISFISEILKYLDQILK